jgi:hypothetical protein
MPHVVPELCGLIFQLRVGLALRSEPEPARRLSRIACNPLAIHYSIH